MNIANAGPDFDRFQIRPVARRRALNRVFLLICLTTSGLSILVLAILLGMILLTALPVLGPYEDRASGESRFVIVQGDNPGNDRSAIDAGDVIQGLVLVQRLERGGLGHTNDVRFAADESNRHGLDGSPPKPPGGNWQIALVSLEIQRLVDDSIARLVPASGDHRLAVTLQRQGIDVSSLDRDGTGLVVLSTNNQRLSASDFDYDLWFCTGERDTQPQEQVDRALAWTVEWCAGPAATDDFAELNFRTLDAGQAANLRRRQELGQLKLLWSVRGRAEPKNSSFHPVRMRPFSSNALVEGDLKIDGAKLVGLNRRDRRGFQLGGDLEWRCCPLSETQGGPLQHAAQFIKQPPRTSADEAGIGPSLAGSIWVVAGCALFALPLGVGTAIFLEEFQPRRPWLRSLHGLLQLNIANLAGVPSIVYGILGLTAFATMFGLLGDAKTPRVQFGSQHFFQYLTEGMEPVLIPIDRPDESPELKDGMIGLTPEMQPIALTVIGPEDRYPEEDSALQWTLRSDAEGGLISKKAWYYFQLPFGRGVLAASLTLMLVVLPVIIIASQEALRAVPSTLREGAMGLGATTWQVVRNVTLPTALPSIMTGSILAISRAIGEAAPILVLCGIVYITSGPTNWMDVYSVLPIQIYYWTGLPVDQTLLINHQNVAAAGIVVLLAILMTFNGLAIGIRQAAQRRLP